MGILQPVSGADDRLGSHPDRLMGVACPLPPSADMAVRQAANSALLLGICPCRQPHRED